MRTIVLLAVLLGTPSTWAGAERESALPVAGSETAQVTASLPASQAAPQPDTAGLADWGKAQYGRGRALVWTGVGLVPVGLLALVPVWYDGAFGITAADPGIGGSILALGGALVHVGIPLMGHGAGHEEEAARARGQGFAAEPSGWGAYRQSWLLIGAGGALILTGFPFAIVAALDVDKQRPAMGYIAGALMYGGAAIGGAGILEQWYSGYRFARSHGKARRSLEGSVSVSLLPLVRPGREGVDGGGFLLMAAF